MFRRTLISTLVTAVLIVMALSSSSRGWAQDRVPIGTVPLFPPVSRENPESAGAINESLVQMNLGAIELSRNVKATGLGGRLAVRTGLYITVTDSSPQRIHLPVQLFGESVLGSLTDDESGISFTWDDALDRGELTIPFGNELVQGSALISTGQMTADGDTVAAEVRSIRISVGEFSLGNETQVGGAAEIHFVGKLVPEVFLVSLEPFSTAEVASIWSKSDAVHDDLELADVLASTSIEAGFIGQFDGDPTLDIRTNGSWRSSNDQHEVRVLASTALGESFVLSEQNYSLTSEGQWDVFSFKDFSEISRIAIVLVEPGRDQIVEPTVAIAESETLVERPTVISMSTTTTTVDPTSPSVEPDSPETGGVSSWLAWVLGGGVLLAGVGVYLLRLTRRDRD